MAEEKSNLISQVEELKMQSKQSDEAFMKSELFQQLVRHNQDLVSLII